MQNSKKKELKTIMPFAILVHEAHFVLTWCKPDAPLLINSGLEPNAINELSELCDVAEQLYSKYTAEKGYIPILRDKLRREFAEASKLRAFIADKMRVVFSVEGEGKKVPGYHRRKCFEIIIADLFDLSALCAKFKTRLEHIGFDMQRADDAQELAGILEKKLLDLKMRVIEKEDMYRQFIGHYHNLYNHLKQIRFIAFNVFPPGSPRRAGYRSGYINKPRPAREKTDAPQAAFKN